MSELSDTNMRALGHVRELLKEKISRLAGDLQVAREDLARLDRMRAREANAARRGGGECEGEGLGVSREGAKSRRGGPGGQGGPGGLGGLGEVEERGEVWTARVGKGEGDKVDRVDIIDGGLSATDQLEEVRKALREKRVSVAALALRAGMTPRALYGVMNGATPKLQRLEALWAGLLWLTAPESREPHPLERIEKAVRLGRVRQTDLARESGLSDGMVSMLLRRKTANPGIKTIRKLERAFARLTAGEGVKGHY